MTDQNPNTHSPDGRHPLSTGRRVVGAIRRCALLGALAIAVLAATAPAALAASSAVTNPAGDVHHTDAVLHGHFELGGGAAITDCHFDWGTTTSYGQTVPCAQGNSFTEPEEVSAELGFLTPGTTYHYRLHLSTSGGDLIGADLTFTPAPFPIGRRDIARFGPDGTSASTFPSLGQLAFDAASSKLYAFAPQTPTGIFGFDASATPAMSPLATFDPLATVPGGEVSELSVDESGLASAGRVYLASDPYHFDYPGGDDEVHAFDPDGTELGGTFPIDSATNPGGIPEANNNSNGVCGVAVDAASDLWVAKANSEALLEYSSTGAFQRVIYLRGNSPNLKAHEFSACRLAFDSNGDLYVAESSGHILKLFAPAYSFAESVEIGADIGTGQEAYNGLAVDPKTHHLFTVSADGTDIDEFDSAGSLISQNHEALPGPEFKGVAVDPANDFLYVSDSHTQQIQVFGSPETLTYPTVTTGSAGRVTDTGARLRGEIDPEGQGAISDCEFQYFEGSGSYTNGVKTVPCASSPGSGSGNVAVSADLGGLQPQTTYHFRVYATNASGTGVGSDATFTTAATAPAVEALETLEAGAITDNSARLQGTLDPGGAAITDCHFDWGATPSYGQTAACSPNPGSGTGDVAVHADISSLQPDAIYYFRLEATNDSGTTLGAGESFVTRGPPQVETTGSPIRTATSAQLLGRVDPREVETTYHFEYGSQGSCGSNPCASTPDVSAGAGGTFEPVAADLESLQPDTTYHYRLIADNGNLVGPAVGEDRTLTTRASDAPLQHGEFAGPPGSDRAWELVSLADTSGNPVRGAFSLSDSGDRALYGVNGGTPISSDGTNQDFLFAEREETSPHSGGWQNRDILPPRSQLIGNLFPALTANDDLSLVVARNADLISEHQRLLGLSTQSGAPATLLPDVPLGLFENYFISDDGSRVLATLGGSWDPSRPTNSSATQVYDVSSGVPALASIMPGGADPSCGVASGAPLGFSPEAPVARVANWVTPDGSELFFPSRGNTCSAAPQLYLHYFASGETLRISPPPLSGSDCGAGFIRSTPGAAFFWTQSRLSAQDDAVASCSAGDGSLGGDVYRYDLADHNVTCVTCVGDTPADVSIGTGSPHEAIAVAPDGSRVYFRSPESLILGAPAGGAIYRVDVATGALAYVAPDPATQPLPGDDPTGGTGGGALSSDGSVFVFHSSAPGLNAVDGQTNGGTDQYYRYNDSDRSLVCVSCSPDGAPPLNSVVLGLGRVNGIESGANMTRLSASGDEVFFSTDSPLVAADHNTAGVGEPPGVGNDIYEWRDGRLLLVTDGTTSHPPQSPSRIAGVTPSGRDVFFTAGEPLTAEAPDGSERLYDARVGGGFTPPSQPSPPCDLNSGACEGGPSGAPSVSGAGTTVFEGPGNPKPTSRCRKGKVRKGGRCVARHKQTGKKHKGKGNKKKHKGKGNKRKTGKRHAHHGREGRR